MATNLITTGFKRTESVDMSLGLPVIVAARWVLVVSGIAFALWNANDLVELRVSVLLVIALAIANFFLHIEVTKKRPVDQRIVYGLSAADLGVVTAVLVSIGEFPATQFIYYLPALAAISVTFATSVTALFTAVTVLAYGGFSVIASTVPEFDTTDGRLSVLIAHVVVLVAVPFCGNVYWRLERDRRQRDAQQAETKAQIIKSADGTGNPTSIRIPVEAKDA